ncbi:MAG: ATP-dependent DNA helicase RecG [Nitrospirota bacterium]
MDSDLSDRHIQFTKGIGPRRAGLFARLGINTVREALYYLPYRYEDRSSLKKISDIRPGDTETVKGRIISAKLVNLRGKKLRIFELTVNDGSGFLKGKWFNQPFMKKNFQVGQEIILHGTVKENPYRKGGFEIDSPEYELIADEDDLLIHTKRIAPVYRVTEGISPKQFRKIMFSIVGNYVERISDPLPPEIVVNNNFPSLEESLKQVHFPENTHQLDLLNSGNSKYHRRLSFDEFFLFELGLAVMKKNIRKDRGIVFSCKGNLQKKLLKILPFELTGAQKKTVDEIICDMQKPYPMNRLIQGDVGCGKTVVALLAMLNAVECGYQTALMAPTEILAEQHYLTIHKYIEQLGLKSKLLTGGSGNRQLDDITSGEIEIIIGTHALIQENIFFRNLGLAVIDEQHKFGVMQRALLRKKGINPDVLVMTATPIPRSLALTLYGDLDCSVIDELPSNRKSVVTKIFNAGQKSEIYAFLNEEINKGKQAYIVYPAIEESEKISLRSAIQGKEAFEKIFPEYRFGLLHGRMNAEERENIMASFKQKEIDILVSTTVIEVGVDVPDATLMIIIHAERFGLAQLHQLRGRVGRGRDRSYCLMIAYEPYGKEAERRLDIMVNSSDGFRIAEEDLKIRGPGEFLGIRQAGMPDMKIADISRDIEILEMAKREAFNLIDKSPELKEFPSLRKLLDVFWKGKIDFYKTG